MEYESNDLVRKETLEILAKTARIQTQMGGADSQAVTMESVLGGETIKTRGNSRCSDNLSPQLAVSGE